MYSVLLCGFHLVDVVTGGVQPVLLRRTFCLFLWTCIKTKCVSQLPYFAVAENYQLDKAGGAIAMYLLYVYRHIRRWRVFNRLIRCLSQKRRREVSASYDWSSSIVLKFHM